MGWGPPAPASGKGEELAAWGELQEEGGGPEALAGGKKSRQDSSGPSCHPAQRGHGSSFSRARPFTPGRGLWVTVAVEKAESGDRADEGTRVPSRRA